MKLKYEIALAAAALAFVVVPLLLRRRAPSFVREFFNTPTDAVNLAVFRIVLLLFTIYFYFTLNVPWYGRMPPELLFPPKGFGWVLAYVPVGEASVRAVSILFLCCCFAGVVGLFTRASLVVGLLSGVYVLGVPQLYGKINHYHHLLWFIAILAVSPCADVLSCDALVAAWRRADGGVTEPPKPSLAYSLPLRFVWLLMGALYFSSGVWKVWTGGYRWAFSDNLRNIMYNKWMEFGDWTPVFRLDQYPLLYKFSAAGSILFELSFVVLIFFPLLRKLAVVGGLIFHNMIYVVMRINFYPLVVCYVSFVNWASLLRLAGGRLFREDLTVIYDGNCKLCRRTVASLRTLDVLGRVLYASLPDEHALEAPELRRVGDETPARDIYAFKAGKVWAGFDAYRALAARIPVLWPVLPFLYLWPVPRVAERIYRRVADHRVCEIKAGGPTTRGAFEPAYDRSRVRAVAIVGAILLYAYGLSAVAKFNSWPVSMYPTFEDLDEPQVSVIVMSAQLPSGQIVEINPIRESSQMAPERLMSLFLHILDVKDEAERQRRLDALWKLWSRDNPQLRQAVSVRFYKDVLSSIPERRSRPPVSRELLADLRLDSPASSKGSLDR
ncbi:MAG TPA: DCC1-like thiol-disulfide oxidoreductase family protein [Pyrinomonadaceae bacterium]|nr:DCC1-like thiol-disulfide oxidoreductase family protein [Pyrinomonadaceae bacterium]